MDKTNWKVLFSGLTNSNANSNGTVKAYYIHIFAYDGDLPLYGDFAFYLNLNLNKGPTLSSTISNKAFIANPAKSYTIPTASIFTDPEGETVTCSISINDTASFLSIPSDCSAIHVTNPSNSNVGSYLITLTGTDGHSDTNTASVTFSLTITLNSPPVKNNTINDYTFQGNRTSTYSFGSNLFYDPDGDTLIYTYIISPPAPFLTISTSSMSWSGTPVNTYAGVYLITIKADDGDPETANATSSFSLTVVANQAPTTTQTISNISSLVYYPIEISWNSSLFTDINGDTPSFTITTNATGSWYIISNSYPKLYGTPSSNSYSGNFQYL